MIIKFPSTNKTLQNDKEIETKIVLSNSGETMAIDLKVPKEIKNAVMACDNLILHLECN